MVVKKGMVIDGGRGNMGKKEEGGGVSSGFAGFGMGCCGVEGA